MNVLPIILTELWMDEYPKCPVRDKTNTEESPSTMNDLLPEWGIFRW